LGNEPRRKVHEVISIVLGVTSRLGGSGEDDVGLDGHD
jgi:hypothetical protein